MIVYCIDDTNLEMMSYTDGSNFYSYSYSSPQVNYARVELVPGVRD